MLYRKRHVQLPREVLGTIDANRLWNFMNRYDFCSNTNTHLSSPSLPFPILRLCAPSLMHMARSACSVL